PKTVVRAGFGLFYDRVPQSLTLDALRQNGVTQQSFTVPLPNFYSLDSSGNLVGPPASQLTANLVPQSIRKVDSTIKAASITQFAVGVDRQMPKGITLSVNYTDSNGLHQLRSVNINAPLPGTLSFPFGNAGPIYVYESSGNFHQFQISTNVNGR